MTGSGEETSRASDPQREAAIDRLKAKEGFRNLVVSALFVTVLVNVIWLATDRGDYWPIWPMIGLGIALVATGYNAYGPRRRGITEGDIEREMRR